MRISRGLKWENKTYKLKRSIVLEILATVLGLAKALEWEADS